MGRRRRRRLHARPAGSQPPETRAASAAAEEPRSEGATGGSLTGRGSKRASVADSAPEKDKRRKLEVGDDGETTEEDEMAATVDRNGSDRNGSDQAVDEQVKTDQNGSNGGGSDENGDEGAGGGSSDPGPLLKGEGDSETSIQVTCGRNEGRLYLTKLRVVVNERCRSKCIRTGNTWWTPNEFQFVSGRGAAKDWKRTVKHAGRCLKALLASGTLSLSSATPRCFCESCTSQGSGKTADDSDEAGRNINESGEDLSNGKLAQDDSNIRKKGIKRGRRIKRHIKGAAPLHGDTSEEPVPFASRKRRKFRRNAKPEAHSDSTVSLSADGVFESGTGSKATEEGGTVAKSSDASSPVPEPPLVVKRRPGRPKKKPAVAVPTKTPDVALRKKTEVKVTAEKSPISGQGVSLIGSNDGPTGCPDDAIPSSERPQDSPTGQTRTGPAGENVLPENYSPRLSDIALTIPSTPASKASPEQPEAAAATSEQSSKNDGLDKDTSRSNGTISEIPATTHDVQRTTHDVQRTTQDVQKTTHDVQATTHEASPEIDALPSDGKAEQESVDEASTYGAADQLPVCPSDKTPSGDMEAQDGVDADRKQTEDDVIVSGDVKDDVKKGSSPMRDDVTETSLTAPNPTEPRRKNAYLNAVIAELKRKKISRETSVTSCSGAKDQQQQQQHQRTRHPSGQLQQPTTLHPTTVSLIKTELCPESKSTSDSLIRDIQSPSFGLTTSSSSSSNPSLAFLPSTVVDGKPPCLKPLHPDAEGKDAAAADVRSGSGTRRTDSRTSARGNLPMSDFPPSEAAYWRHLQSSMVGAEEKAGGGGGGGKPGVGGRVADMSSPISISQLASICGLSQSQLASLPFPPPQFSLYPPYLFMGFPLQPLLPEFQSVSGSLPPSPAAAAATTTGGHGSVQRPPSRPVPPAASSSSTTTAPSSQYQQHQQQQPRRRRSHHHHHCKSSSSSSASGPPKDPLFRQPPPDRHAASFSALRKTEAIPTNHSAALISELNRWRSTTPGLSNNQPWTGSTTKSSAPNKFSPTGSSAQERKLWRPAAAIASSAKEYSSAYESIVASRPSAHASTKEFAVTCRSYGDTSLAAHAYRFDSSAPVDFTRRFRARDEEERKYSSNTGSEEYPCDEQGVLDLSKK